MQERLTPRAPVRARPRAAARGPGSTSVGGSRRPCSREAKRQPVLCSLASLAVIANHHEPVLRPRDEVEELARGRGILARERDHPPLLRLPPAP